MNPLYEKLPIFLQNLAISLVNTYQYKIRHSGKYHFYKKYYANFENKNMAEIQDEHNKRLEEFLLYANQTNWYKVVDSLQLHDYPVLEKQAIIENLEQITTIPKNDKRIESKTGGTTGTSMKVYYTPEDMQERFALLDHFREKFGYKLGEKTAWFSGKKIVTVDDLKKGLCYRDDFINKIRFFSTFDINTRNFESYWNALHQFKPEFIVGYPSSVYEICLIAKQKGLQASFQVKTFFPTAETVLSIHRDVISEVLGCKVVDQYASSEGAPFILQCEHGGMHIHPLTGIFEYRYPNTDSKEILVTSFSTRGTPLIRYAIGDAIELETDQTTCACGSDFPLVKSIKGRNQDYIETEDLGRISTAHITLCIKDVQGILLMQIVQKKINVIEIYLVTNNLFNDQQQKKFISNFRRLIGTRIEILLNLVDDIPKEKSGKFRIVKNLIEKL